MANAFIVELRKKSSNFTGVEKLHYVKSHIKAVDGLLDAYDKLNVSLFPSSMLNTKKLAGSINDNTTFANLFTLLKTFNDSNASLYPGTYFISNGKNVIEASTDHVIYYNDDGQNASDSVTLEHGDHLFYIKKGDEYAWKDTTNRLTLLQEDGIIDLTPPYNTILAKNIFATEAEMVATTPPSNGAYALVTGFKWVPSNQTEYNGAASAGYQISKVGPNGVHTAIDANLIAIPTWYLYDHGQGNTIMRLEREGVGYSYWKLVKEDPTFDGYPKIYQSESYSNKHIWGVVNSSYDLATPSSAGLMSAADKLKLNGLISNATHTGDVTGSVALTIANGAVTLDKMANLAADSIIGNNTGSSAPPKALSKSDVRDLLNVADGADVTPTFTKTGTEGSLKTITAVTLNGNNKLTGLTFGDIPSASVSSKGVVQLANNSSDGDWKTSQSTSEVTTPQVVKSMIDFFSTLKIYANVDAANDANLPDGTFALIQAGTVTIS